MHLVLLPLTYKGNERKQQAIIECVDLSRMISDKEQETFVFAGILAFTDKVIDDTAKQHIKEVPKMCDALRELMKPQKDAALAESNAALVEKDRRIRELEAMLAAQTG